MDYNDNDYKGQNLPLAGEGNVKFSPVLRPYALPKFDFDDSLHGSLRFDGLVETEVFLGIESNEDNQWIEEYSRANSGIEFRTSAAESCSISRHNNVWSEATSSESVEMLLKSVGQEESIPGKTIMRESDACDELGCIIKQMEPGPKHDDNNLIKEGDVQPMLPPDQILGSCSGLKEDVVGGQHLVDMTSQKNECETSVGCGSSDPISDAVSGKFSLPLSNDSNVVDQRKGNTLLESPTNRTEEDSSASGTQFDSAVTSALNISTSSGEMNRQDAPHKENDTGENVDVSQAKISEHGDKHHLSEVETNYQNLDGSAADSGTPQLENPLHLASKLESLEEGNIIEASAGKTGEPSNMLEEDADLHTVEECNGNVQDAKCVNQVPLKDTEIGDTSKVNMHETSLVSLQHDNKFERHGIEVSNTNDSEAFLLPLEEKNVSKGEAVGSSGSDGGGISTSKECSVAEWLSQELVTLNSKGVNDDSGVCREDSTAEANVSSFSVGESAEVREENVVSRQSDDNSTAVDVKESKELPSECSSMDRAVGGCLIMDKSVGSLSLGEGSTENELIVSKSHSDVPAVNESALENARLVSHGTTEGVILPSGTVDTGNADVIHQEVQMMDACNEKRQSDEGVVLNEVSQECLKGMDACTVAFDSGKEVHGADARPLSEKHAAEVTMKTNLGKTSLKASDAELLSKDDEMLPQPLSLPSDEIQCDVDQNGQEDNKSMLISGEKLSGQVTVPHVDGDTSKFHVGSTSSTPLSESNAKFPVVECGSSDTNLDKYTCGSPTVIRTTALSQSENDKKEVTGSTDQSSPIQSVFPDSKGNDASKGEKTFTFEVGPVECSSEREGGKKWKPFSTVQVATPSPTVEGSPSTSCVGQLNSKTAQGASRGNLQVSDRQIVCSGSKGTSERKKRRASTKAAVKEIAKKGNTTKDIAPVQQSDKGDRTSNVSLSPSGIGQFVHSIEMQHYGHVDCSNMKPFLFPTSASTLPDLNTSSIFHQPFTDLQQVQLRAQIFVYGASIQGTAPDEAYMISAFGGPDGGRSMWETSWRACMERLRGQKSVLNNAETPLQSSSGARAPDQATKHGAIPGKVASSSLGQATSKGTPAPVVNPMVAMSSPLWSIPTPSTDTLQSSCMTRSAVMDYQQGFSPLHPHQTPPIRNFVGHSTWISQAPFRGTWAASPQTSGFDGSARFPVFPMTETVQLTPVKEPSVPHSSGVKHISSGPMIQSVSPATVFPGTSSMLDPRKVTLSPSQHSTDPKPRKRKKIPASENIGQIMIHSQSQTEPVPAPIVNSLLSTTVSITTPGSILSKAYTDKVIMPVSLTTSADLPKGGNKEAQQRASLSEESLTKLKEARTQAEEAAAFAASAISHSQQIWNQLDKQKNSQLVPDVDSKLASAVVAIAAAAAVAKAAAAAANVAASAAQQAKLMADEALDASGSGNSSQISGTSLSDSVKDMGKATPASILKVDNALNGSSSIIFAAREAARRKIEAASAASKRAENMDAIVKAAELAAAAVSQAGKLVAMGDPMPLNELIEAGPEGYWKVPLASAQLVAKSTEMHSEKLNVDSVAKGPDATAKNSKEVSLDNREIQTSNQGRSTLRNMSGESFDNHNRLTDGFSVSAAASGKNTKGHRGSKALDLAKTIGVVPESEIGSRSPSVTIQFEQERGVDPSNENNIKEGSCVEVLKEGVRSKAGWFTANVLSLKEGKAYVCYNELPSDEGSEKLKEWVALNAEGNKSPNIRIARPVTAMPFEGTRKRRRAAMGEHTWSVGDRVDAWMQVSWWEGIVTEKSKKEETMYTVHFPAQGETSAVRAWHLRPSFIWKDGEWVEWSSSAVNNSTSHEGDTPQEKRLRLGSPMVEAKGKDKISKGIGIVESGKCNEPTLLDLAANEKMFNIGKSSRHENKPDTLRMIRTGLQKEGSRVVFGVPKPGKKRKFMDVSKHCVVDQGSKVGEANNSVKFAKYLMPQSQGSGSRGWKNPSRSEPKEKRVAVSKPKVLKSGKPPSVPGRTIPQKNYPASSAVSTPDDGSDIDHIEKIKDFARHVDNASGKHDAVGFQSLSTSEGAAEAPILFSSMPLSSDAPSKKVSTSNPRTERVTKGKLAPAGGKLTKTEDKVFNGNSTKMSSEVVEPRRSNRRIQPTSRLLEGLQSSMIISKIPSVSHEKSQKSQNRSISRGNNNG